MRDNQRVLLASRPNGWVDEGNFRIEERRSRSRRRARCW